MLAARRAARAELAAQERAATAAKMARLAEEEGEAAAAEAIEQAKRDKLAAIAARRKVLRKQRGLTQTAQTLPQLRKKERGAEREDMVESIRRRAMRFKQAKSKPVQKVLSELRDDLASDAARRRKALEQRYSWYREEKPRDGLYTLAVAKSADLNAEAARQQEARVEARYMVKCRRTRDTYINGDGKPEALVETKEMRDAVKAEMKAKAAAEVAERELAEARDRHSGKQADDGAKAGAV